MNISAVTLFPDLYKPFLSTSLIKRASDQGLVSCSLYNLFSSVPPRERIDAPTYGHGAGMLLRPDVIERAVNECEEVRGPAYKIFFSPSGDRLTTDVVREIYEEGSKKGHVMLLPARYEGMDSRVEEHYADRIISVGDFVLMGGDLPAMMLIEALMRFIPGVVGKQESVEKDSFSGPFVDFPAYTEPLEWKGMRVPEVVRSGNHKELDDWRMGIAARKSTVDHFDWVRSHILTAEQQAAVRKNIPPHYAILMHDEVMLPHGESGSTSVTSIDIHDIARSAHTYGLKGYYLVTPLLDQQKIIQRLLDFWSSEVGIDYNPQRHEALQRVRMVSSLQEACEDIRRRESKEILLVGTSARMTEYEKHACPVTYYDQKELWRRDQPLVFVLGTGRGLAPVVLERCDFMLPPIFGFAQFNHLSVRSAAAIVFDRWLGNSIKRKLGRML